MKKTEEIKNIKLKSAKELLKELESCYQKSRKLRFDLEFKKLKDTSAAKQTKKKIARIWSILNEKLGEKEL